MRIKKPKVRNYTLEYARDHASAKAKKDRAARNKGRSDLGLKVGDSREAHHPVPLTGRGSNKNGSRKQKTRAVSREYNRKQSNKPPTRGRK